MLTRAVVRDVYAPDHAASALGYLAVATVGFPAFVPWLGGAVFESFGWHAIFIILLGVGLLGLMAAILRLPETNLNPIERVDFFGILRTFGGLLKKPVFLGYTGFMAFHTGAYFTFANVVPLVIERHLGVNPGVYARFYVITALGYFIGSLVAGRLNVRLGMTTMMQAQSGREFHRPRPSSPAWCCSGELSLWSLFGTMTFICMGYGLGAPSATMGAINVNPRVAGAASGLIGGAQMATGAILTNRGRAISSRTQAPCPSL